MHTKSRNIGIIGSGFTGTAVLLNILDRAIANAYTDDRQEYNITMYNRDEDTRGGGVAYGMAGPEHRTNSWVRQMSPFVHKPDDMIEWVVANRGLQNKIRPELQPYDLARLGPDDPIPRPLYQIYLQDRVQDLTREARMLNVLTDYREATGNVTRLRKVENVWCTEYHGPHGQQSHQQHDDVVLAVGHVDGHKPPFLDHLDPGIEKFCVKDVWHEFDNVKSCIKDPAVSTIGIIGTGLTSYDMVVTAAKQGFFDHPENMIYLVSRNTHLHQKDDQPNPPMPTIVRGDIPDPPKDIKDIPAYVGDVFGKWIDKGYDIWTIERQLRPFVPGLIKQSGIDPRELAKLAKKHNSLITASVAGVGREVYDLVHHYIDKGRVRVIRAGVDNLEATPDGQGVIMNLTPAGRRGIKSLSVDRVFNAAGFSDDFTQTRDPLIRQLIQDEIITVDPVTGMGVAVNNHHHPVHGNGQISENLFLVGPLTKGNAMMGGRFGAFAVNVVGMRQAINDVADTLAGFVLLPGVPNLVANASNHISDFHAPSGQRQDDHSLPRIGGMALNIRWLKNRKPANDKPRGLARYG